MSQGPMKSKTAESTPPSNPGGDAFRTLPQKDSRVTRRGYQSYGESGANQKIGGS